jgi:hypothetical protein
MSETVPIACTLDPTRMNGRAKLIASLGEAMTAVDVAGSSATLRFSAQRRADIEQFVRLESECCPFFEFSVEESVGETALAITVPDEGEPMLRGLVAGFAAGRRGQSLGRR